MNSRAKQDTESGEKEGGDVASQDPSETNKKDKSEARDPAAQIYYPLRSLHRSPAVGVVALPSDLVTPVAECARFRPMTTLPSSSPSETRASAGAGVAVIAVAVVDLAGMMKYLPIARRTAAFAVPPMPPLSSTSGRETVIRWLGIGDSFLYYTPQQ